MSVNHLFSPLQLSDLQLKNRLFMAPMTRNRAAAGGVPTELNAKYYAQRASAGLIITEGTYPHISGRGYVNQPGLSNAEQVAGWRKVTDAVHAAGGIIFVQIHHAGRISHAKLTDGQAPVAASAIQPQGEVHVPDGKESYPVPRSLETSEIPNIIEQFRYSTELAFEAGFDGVELHGANGYLPHTFLSNRTNQRTDAYGGSIENRVRFYVEVLQAMASVRGPERVGVKLSPGHFPPHDIVEDDTQDLYPYLAEELSQVGIGYLHVQQPITDWGMDGLPYDVFQLIRPHFRGVFVAGATFDRDKGEAILAKGLADAIAFGRSFLANPDLPHRLEVGADLNPVDYQTFYTPGEKGYTDYPALSA